MVGGQWDHFHLGGTTRELLLSGEFGKLNSSKETGFFPAFSGNEFSSWASGFLLFDMLVFFWSQHWKVLCQGKEGPKPRPRGIVLAISSGDVEKHGLLDKHPLHCPWPFSLRTLHNFSSISLCLYSVSNRVLVNPKIQSQILFLQDPFVCNGSVCTFSPVTGLQWLSDVTKKWETYGIDML